MPTLNLPILDRLADSRSILITGIGGGFDLFCGLPLYFHLRERGYQVHLANYSFADIESFTGGIRLSDTLVGVTADYQRPVVYFPELYLAQWFQTARQQAIPIWAFHIRHRRNNLLYLAHAARLGLAAWSDPISRSD